MSEQREEEKLVGADRVLAVLIDLAGHPQGATLDEMAQRLQSSKPTVHRALSSLRRAGLADQVSRGVYALGDEFIRLAFRHHAAKPDAIRIEPALQKLARQYGETAHFAVLSGTDVVYRAKVDPAVGSVRLTSEVGGRNPAHRTAVGKMLLSHELHSEAELVEWLRGQPLEARTPSSITTVPALWAELEATRNRGYAVDDQENEIGLNCVAVLADLGTSQMGAVSVSALAFRLPLEKLIAEVPTIRAIVNETRGIPAA
ncbi:IclR family transcriptional regulator [Arthrobacter sp. StoSoilB22]|uniref:IclR family transcriptional regulator n=1 Tax=Arthrobacter sp. StoSoilB22 TaxID=2830996 RepID=UPI001CC38333|nr:IclR family transcriptional regulator [Arthrobacter sp. StoSoilB22]BCW62891.1 IclR family transcriptional regulator [Arthrobacter sp. StoSoilB22]